MYLRHTIRRKDGKVHRYWCLVRSVRVGRRVIQQTVVQLGELDERGRIEARTLARQLIGTPEQAHLFKDGSEDLTVPVRLKGIRIERSRQYSHSGAELALRNCAGSCCQWARNVSPGRGRHGSASRRASCTLPRIGTVGRR